jgi:hypothetical protein
LRSLWGQELGFLPFFFFGSGGRRDPIIELRGVR